MEESLISVIVPVYNAEQFLGQCLDSILKQTYPNLEVICVDDGSTDASLSICKQYREKDSRVRVIHKDNEGVSCARNRGVASARGQFVFFIDADDYLDKNALKACMLHHNGRMNVIVAVNYDRVSVTATGDTSSGWTDIEECCCKNLSKKKVLDLISVRRGCYIWGMLIPKPLLDRYQLKFPEDIRNLEDVTWLGMTLCYVENIVFIGAELYHYRENPVSITSNCVDYSWQAEHWMKAYSTLVSYFTEHKLDNYRYMHSRRMLRYCKNNFYAECYAGKILWHEAKKICQLKKYSNKQIRYLEYLAYNCYFKLSRIIKKNRSGR